jgi:hypothetical protein
MDNSTATKPRSTLKGDAYRAYEELPREARRALQEALVDWCPLRAQEWHQHLLRRMRMRPAEAAAALVQVIRRQDHAEVAAFARGWAKGVAAYPHLAAGASLQRYAGTEGIPAPEPISAPKRASAPRPAKPAPSKSRAAHPRPAKPAKPMRAKRPKPVAKRKSARRGRR